MISLLKDWKGKVEVNGIIYDSISSVNDKDLNRNPLSIILYPVRHRVVVEQPKEDLQIYRIKVKSYMTRPATDTFDFMKKWNNDVPMPVNIMEGVEVKETRGMVFMKLWHDLPGGGKLEWEGWVIKSAIISKEPVN